jgi:thiol:disulfide interchange protein DsbA
VAGRYYIDGTLAGSMDRALKVAESLVAQSRNNPGNSAPAKKQS